MSSYESAFRTRLQKKLDDAGTAKTWEIASGGIISVDASSTGQAYVQIAGYLQALRDVAALMQEVEDDLLGRQRE